MGRNKGLIGEFWEYMKARKAWWLLPLIIMIIILSLLLVFSQASTVSPFIYALF